MLININTADENEISQIYGIGSKLAKRIVEYRHENGFFQQPADLAKVEGISEKYALLIASQIDWNSNVSDIKIEDLRQGEIKTLLGFSIFLGFVLNTLNTLPSIYTLFPNSEYGTKLDFFDLSNLLTMTFGFIAFTIFVGLKESKIKITWAQKFMRVTSAALLVSLIVAGGKIVFSNLYSPNLFTSLGQPNTLSYLRAATLLAYILYSIFLFVPLLLIMIHPLLLQNHKTVNTLEFGILIIGLIISILFWNGRQFLPAIEILIVFISGIILFFWGVMSFRKDFSFVSSSLEFITPTNIVDEVTRDSWILWINTHVPNPDDQKKLKSVLDDLYPNSKNRYILWTLIVVIGSWIVSTTLSAVAEWIIQRILDIFFT